jgi:hypothetical protein
MRTDVQHSGPKSLSPALRLVLGLSGALFLLVSVRWLRTDLLFLKQPVLDSQGLAWLYGFAAAFAGLLGLSFFLSAVTGRWQGVGRWLIMLVDAVR